MPSDQALHCRVRKFNISSRFPFNSVLRLKSLCQYFIVFLKSIIEALILLMKKWFVLFWSGITILKSALEKIDIYFYYSRKRNTKHSNLAKKLLSNSKTFI